MNRSIDLMESLADVSDNLIHMERRGYLYATCRPRRDLQAYIHQYSQLDVGECRIQDGRQKHAYSLPAGVFLTILMYMATGMLLHLS
ncbi:MAG: hypothetical protein WA996_20960 [Candidatus Promineifilaceae bacterium]